MGGRDGLDAAKSRTAEMIPAEPNSQRLVATSAVRGGRTSHDGRVTAAFDPVSDISEQLNCLWISAIIETRHPTCAFCSLKGPGSPPVRSQDDLARSGTKSRSSRRQKSA